jgi:hypothetical protein
MVKMNTEAKIAFAKECTLLAIEHKMLTVWDKPNLTAKEVTTFFKTVFDNLDPDTTEET